MQRSNQKEEDLEDVVDVVGEEEEEVKDIFHLLVKSLLLELSRKDHLLVVQQLLV
jgi:vacuolar-type H+-ATPase catalytic subunit A/Vma1